MKGRSILSAVVVLCLLGLVALVVTMPAAESEGGWLFNRHQAAISQPADAAPMATKGEGFFPHTKTTIKNCERITSAIKAGISAAGKEVDKEEAKAKAPEVQAPAAPPVVQTKPTKPVKPIKPTKEYGYPVIYSGGGYPVINSGGGYITMQRQCGLNGCQLVPVEVPAAEPSQAEPQVDPPAVSACDGQDCCPQPRRGLFGRRR